MEVLGLIRSWRNTFSPINRTPTEVLTLIPDFWGRPGKEKAVIALTHVCRAWREVFTSRSSLWTVFDCLDGEKTRTYLERSKSSPINLRVDRDGGLSHQDPFLQIAPHAISRLKYLTLGTRPDHLESFTNYLSLPAPILEDLRIFGSNDDPFLNPTLTTTLFNGDLSSLRTFYLFSVCTELPRRNMVNLTTFNLGYVLEPRVTIKQLLDFFESAPYLLNVALTFATPAFGAQNGRLVLLAHLRRLHIEGFHPPSLLLEHLLIPVGANMTIDLDMPGPEIEDHLPRSLDNLRNFPDFTKICLCFDQSASLKFIGPNGQVCLSSTSPTPDTSLSLPRSLAQFDTSKAVWLEIIGSDYLSEHLEHALLSLINLQTLTLSLCERLYSFILALLPDPNSTNPIPCPKLKALILRTEERFDIVTMVEVAATRASVGAPFNSVRVINCGEFVPREGVDELMEHVSHVETNYEINGEVYSLYGDDSDDEELDEEGGSFGSGSGTP